MLLSSCLHPPGNKSLKTAIGSCESLVSGVEVLQDRAKQREADAQHCIGHGCLEKSFQMDTSRAKLCQTLFRPLKTQTAAGKLLTQLPMSHVFRTSILFHHPNGFNK